MSNFVRNINSTYCSKGNMECLPSSCENSLSKNCASLLNIESLPRTSHLRGDDGVMLDLALPMASTPGDLGMGSGHFSSPKPQSSSVCSCPSPHKVAGSFHMSSYTWEKRNLTCRWLKQSWVLSGYHLIFFQVKNPKEAGEKLFECSRSVLRPLLHCFYRTKLGLFP